jgi:peptidoglycan hydrolase-like protein with peptidoglycan-binding domain
MTRMSSRSKALIAAAALAALALVSMPAAAAGEVSIVTLTASEEQIVFGETVTLTASTVPAVVGEPIAIVDASGHELASGNTGQNGSFSAQVQPKANLLVHASLEGVDSSPVSLGVRPIMTLRSGAIRLFDDVRVRGTFRPIRQGERVTIELQHLGTVVATKRPVMDANGRFSATFRVPQAGSFRARAVLDADDLLPGRAATAPSVTPLPDLSSGARGIFVGLLERRLVQLHYHLAGVDQIFDHRTADAVMAFRKVQRLPRTQDVNTAVWRALGAPKLFVPRNRADGVHVEVDQTRQVLAVVKDGAVQAMIHVSTGKPSTPTRDGTFQVFSKLAGSSPKGLYYPSFFDGERAIHGWTDVPTYAASHGCVRIPYWVTLWMFAQDPIGTPVIVYH